MATSSKSSSKKSATKSARHRRGAEARAKNMATPRGATPSKTAETSNKRAQKQQPDAAPRNASKDKVRPGGSKDTKGKATHELESSNPQKRPSRKSSRGGANHAKADSQLKNRQTRAVRSPKARSQSRAG